MTRTGELFLLVLAALILECVGALVAIEMAGGGHGTYIPAIVLFPYSLALTRLTQSITTPLVVIALVQYPVYAVTGWALGKGSFREIRWIILGVVHSVGIGAAFLFAFEH